MNGHDAFFPSEVSKASYYASAKGIASVVRQGAKEARKPKLRKLSEAEARGRAARVADTAAKERGSAGISTESRPSFGARRKAWDRGFNTGLAKSYIPTKGYKAAKDLTAMERKIVGAKASGKTVRLKRPDGSTTDVKAIPNREKSAPSAAGRKLYAQHSIAGGRGKLTKVVASRSQTGMHPSVEGFSQPDGRGGGRIVVHDDADFKTTAAHELQHILPRRNPHRFFERAKDPVRLGREEGRADFVAHGNRQTTGQYPGSGDFQRGYNEVQGKMAAAHWRKEKFGAPAPQPKKRSGFLRRKP